MQLQDYLDATKNAASNILTTNPLSPTNVFKMEDVSHQLGDKALDFAFQNPYDRDTAEQLIPHSLSSVGLMGVMGGMMPEGSGAMAGDYAKSEFPAKLANERGGLTLGPGEPPPATSLTTPAASSPWYSRIDAALQEKLPEKYDPGQAKNILSTLPTEEAKWRGINDFIEQKHGPVSKAETMEFLKQNPVELGEKQLGGKWEAPKRRDINPGAEYENEQEIQDRATELAQEDADQWLENGDFQYDPGPGNGVEPIDRGQENIDRGSGQTDLWGKPISPLPDKYIIRYNDEPVMHDDLSNYHQKRSNPNEEGHAVFDDQSAADDAFYEHIQPDEESARDEAYREYRQNQDEDTFLNQAREEVGIPIEEPVDENGDPILEQIPHTVDPYSPPTAPVNANPYSGPAKFENYSTPGGSNYREVLMTLPQKATPEGLPPGFKVVKFGDAYEVRGPEAGGQGIGSYSRGLTPEEAVQGFRTFHGQNFGAGDQSFRGGHWDEPNVLAHLRLKDFTDPTTGRKSLLVDEIQSDWHQKGRSHGYKENIPEVAPMESFKVKQTDDQYIVEADGERPLAIGKGTVDSEQAAKEYAERYWVGKRGEQKSANVERVPDAPFKKNWHELAFKRALTEAAKGGYDEMSWTTGDQQAERYNLSKQVQNISWNTSNEGSRIVRIVPRSGNDIEFRVMADGKVGGIGNARSGTQFDGKNISEVVGKDIAQKIMGENRPGDLSGNGLKIGGEGMKGFYDEILPTYANKYLKKYGVKVGTSKIPNAPKPYQFSDTGWVNAGDTTSFPTEQAAMDAANQTVHSIPITPEMRADILGKGQPMWQVPAMVGAGAAAGAGASQTDEKHYAKGGIVGQENDMDPDMQDDRYNVSLGDTSTARGIPSAPTMPMMPPAPPKFNPLAGLPPPTAPLPTAPAPAAPMATPPTSDDLSPFLAQQRAALSKYGPEQQMAFEQEMAKRRGSIPRIAGNAMTGLADALMQGVARAGPSNFQQNLEARNDKTEAGLRSGMERAQTGQMAQVKQEMELAQLDPASPISKMAQRAYGSTLKAMPGGQNLTDAQIAAIPASTIGDILAKKVDLAKALAEVENTEAYRDATLAIQRGAQAEGIRHAKTEEGIAKGAKQTDAAKALAGRGVIKRTMDYVTGNPAVKTLENQAAGFDPDVVAYASKHGITNEAAQIQKDRRMGGK